jgi:hypothetical protein
MSKQEFEAVAWNNGKTGYGLKISARNRDAFLRREWRTIDLHLAGRSEPIKVNIDKSSFWNDTCRELISKEIGTWFEECGLAPWPKGHPPKLRLVLKNPRSFVVYPAG